MHTHTYTKNKKERGGREKGRVKGGEIKKVRRKGENCINYSERTFNSYADHIGKDACSPLSQ